jgi:hypothetical protein
MPSQVLDSMKLHAQPVQRALGKVGLPSAKRAIDRDLSHPNKRLDPAAERRSVSVQCGHPEVSTS